MTLKSTSILIIEEKQWKTPICENMDEKENDREEN